MAKNWTVTGATYDSSEPTLRVSASDTGTGTESATPPTQKMWTVTGATYDADNPETRYYSASDTATGFESNVFAADISGVADTASGVDASALFVARSATDTATGAEASSVVVVVGAVNKSAFDTAVATDTWTGTMTVTRRVTGSDSAVGVDSSGAGAPTIPATITHTTYTVAATGSRTTTATTNQITVAEISDTSPIPA